MVLFAFASNAKESHVKMASEISKLLNNESERERITSQYKNSSTIISDNQSVLILESAFKDEVLSNQQIGLSNIDANKQQQVENDLPSSIDLSKYIESDSESDSESDVEYESDSEDENTREMKNQ